MGTFMECFMRRWLDTDSTISNCWHLFPILSDNPIPLYPCNIHTTGKDVLASFILLSSPKNMFLLIWMRQEGRVSERNINVREKHPSGPIHTRPDQRWNPPLFVVCGTTFQPTEPPSQGWTPLFLTISIHLSLALLLSWLKEKCIW